ncbi:MAG: cell filamentation protein Fic [Acidobacteria bacterium RIFCSPLOWO2_12_FULL_67_14]|nr:MAG: cell filamentation protein Fic [Acidobacteria bacterium RIFCSPLOWO2_02_FULL_67_21]OFW37102.1 MAG: cell filamentation protein Fic [Acidobacteria bacterium RIFCSPLOWO2_12_FULL_67_14]
MDCSSTDIRADTKAAIDRGETTGLMEPLVLSEGSPHRPALNDLAVELAATSAGFRRGLPPGVVKALADLVRAMNCYYSNLIEGHDTHPVDIERAMKNDYSADAGKRNLQLEAKAHVSVQGWIDGGGLAGRAVSTQGIVEVHRRFGELLPAELLKVNDPDSGEERTVMPGELRHRDVKVGRHIPISPGAVPRFLARFENVYGALGRSETILTAAAAHHRLLWIHPFLDGNGRVARLMSHAVLLEALGTGGIWSVARGLARSENNYKSHLAACDATRRNDLDGRGALSEEALAAFTRFFLETCLDQVRFMEELVQPNRLRDRILLWVEEEARANSLPVKAGQVLEAILFRGELPRGDVSALLGMSDRQARRVVATLLERGVLVSDSARAPLFLAFPAALAPRWMPGLFPEKS